MLAPGAQRPGRRVRGVTSVLYRLDHWMVSPLTSESPRLRGGRCDRCGKIFFPRFDVCPGCMSTEPMTEVPLSRYGTLYCYSVVHVNRPGFTAPYVVAYVDLLEGPRVFGHLDSRADLGSEVEIYGGPIGHDGAGNQVISVRFRAARPRNEQV